MYIWFVLFLSCLARKKVDPVYEVQIDIEENRWVDKGLLLRLAFRSTDGTQKPLHRIELTAGRYHETTDLSGRLLNAKRQTAEWVLPLPSNNIFIIQGSLVYGEQKTIGFSAITAPTRENRHNKKLEDQ